MTTQTQKSKIEAPEESLDPMTKKPMKRFRLEHAIIDFEETLVSREVGRSEYFDSFHDMVLALYNHELFYASIGRKIWTKRFFERVGTQYESLSSSKINYYLDLLNDETRQKNASTGLEAGK